MSYLRTATYREREREWRERAANLNPGRERDACITLADGYQKLIELVERIELDTGGC